MSEPLLTARSVLTRLSVVDAEFLHELMNSPPYLQFVGDRGLDSVQKTERYINEYFLASQRKHRFGYFIASNRDGEKVGVVGFLKKDYLQYPDIGFAFLPGYQSQGLGYEVSNKVMEHAIENYAMTRIDAVVAPDNFVSQGLLQKLNFQAQGSIVVPGQEQQSLLYHWRMD
ncbi:MAG: GNAT family N-acetyltransferase [Pseudomonadota bacterium]